MSRSGALLVACMLLGCRRAGAEKEPIERDKARSLPRSSCEALPRALPTRPYRDLHDLAWSVHGLALLQDVGPGFRVFLRRADGSSLGALNVDGQRLQVLPDHRIAVLGSEPVIIDLARGCHERLPFVRPGDEALVVDPVRRATLVARAGELAWQPLTAGPPIEMTSLAATTAWAERRGDLLVTVGERGVELHTAATMAVRAKHDHGFRVLATALSPGGDRVAIVEERSKRGGTRRWFPRHGPRIHVHGIHVLDADGHEIDHLALDATHVAWSHDGRSLAFAGDGLGLFRDGVVTMIAVADPSPIAWAPDDQAIASVRDSELVIRKLDGTLVRSIAAEPTP
jgi:hypothetical protein